MRRRAFTFIEIMLVASLFAILSVAIFGCLLNGIRLADRAQRMMSGEDSLVFFDRISSDLRNTFHFANIDLAGEEARVAFPCVVWTEADRVSMRAAEGLVDQIGRVAYAYDPVRAVIVRRQANYSQAIAGSWGPEAVLVKGVTRLRFRYFHGVSMDAATHIEPGDDLPSGVEIELAVTVAGEERVFKRYIAVPAGV